MYYHVSGWSVTGSLPPVLPLSLSPSLSSTVSLGVYRYESLQLSEKSSKSLTLRPWASRRPVEALAGQRPSANPHQSISVPSPVPLVHMRLAEMKRNEHVEN